MTKKKKKQSQTPPKIQVIKSVSASASPSPSPSLSVSPSHTISASPSPSPAPEPEPWVAHYSYDPYFVSGGVSLWPPSLEFEHLGRKVVQGIAYGLSDSEMLNVSVPDEEKIEIDYNIWLE